MNPFRLFIPAVPPGGCAASVVLPLQPAVPAASITRGMADDVEQLLRAGHHDRAFECLLESHQAKVFRMALVILRDRGRAEETTQDIFIKLWKALPLYDGRAAVSTWLYTIARNTCLSVVRAEGYRKTSALESAPEPSASSETLLSISVEQSLSRLPDLQRQVVTLFYMQDRSVSEVAEMLDLPQGTVKSHLHRARRALGEMMAPDGGTR